MSERTGSQEYPFSQSPGLFTTWGFSEELGPGITPPIQRQWLLQEGGKRKGREQRRSSRASRVDWNMVSAPRIDSLDWQRKNLEPELQIWKGIFGCRQLEKKQGPASTVYFREQRRAGLPRTPSIQTCLHSLGLEHVGRGSVDQFTSPAPPGPAARMGGGYRGRTPGKNFGN